jgi:hypothetical protein
MKRFRNLPTAAMIIAVIALVLALGGTGFAAKKLLTLGAFTDGAKNKTVGVGKVTYVTTTTPVPAGGPVDTFVSAQCPAGLTVTGGGIKMSSPFTIGVESSYPTTSGWAGAVYSQVATTATTTAICAKSRAITGAPPSS